MVIDTSALVAILQGEPDRRRLLEAIDQSAVRRISVVTVVETSMVIEARYGSQGQTDLDRLLAKADIEVVPVDAGQGQIARAAFVRFGKGRHPAALNFGDCFSYALAVSVGEPLLCIGNDFRRTDVTLPD